MKRNWRPPVDPAALLLPDQPGAFDPSRPDSPLAYTLQRLTRVLTDEAGRHTGQAEAVDCVVVTGKTRRRAPPSIISRSTRPTTGRTRGC